MCQSEYICCHLCASACVYTYLHVTLQGLMYNDGEGVLESRLKWRGSTVVTKEDKNVPVHQSCIQFHLVVQQGPGEMLALLVLSLNRKNIQFG